MLSSKAAHTLRPCLRSLGQKNLHVTVPAAQKGGKSAPAPNPVTDPIQQLFVTKIREYNQKKKTIQKAGKFLVDATPELEKKYDDEMDRINKMFNLTPETALKPPEFKFADPKIEVEYATDDDFYKPVDAGNPYCDLDMHQNETDEDLDNQFNPRLSLNPMKRSYISMFNK